MSPETPIGEAPAPSRNHFTLRAPPPLWTLAYCGGLSLVIAALLWLPHPGGTTFLLGLIGVFLLPSVVSAGATSLLASALGGRLEFHRSCFLVFSLLVLLVPIVAVWRLAGWIDPSLYPSTVLVLLFLLGPMFWFRHATIFGISSASHPRSLPVSLLQPVLTLLGALLIYGVSASLVLAAGVILLLGFLCAILLLRAADRPLRREFRTSGMTLVRPMLDHIATRDPEATARLEAFFDRAAIPADLYVSLIAFQKDGTTKATIALPTVHPGPFAALGASDLPRKIAERLGAKAGLVLVPHTPCDHDLDLPTEHEVDRISEALERVFASLPRPERTRASPLVSPYDGSLARAQRLADATVVLVTQAPEPTDDIAYSVADRIYREIASGASGRIALIDAHNSYIEDLGDIVFGTPRAEQLVTDVRAAISAADASARDGPILVGTALRGGYSIGRHGIGPAGIRVLVVRAAGTSTAYALIDGNNLMIGMRAPILSALVGLVDSAEVMTTDNHVVHEVDGGINPVGERYSAAELARDVRELVQQALTNLEPVEVRTGSMPVPAVRTLGPSYTARLLTSLSDTRSMFTNALLTTFMLLCAASLLVVFALR